MLGRLDFVLGRLDFVVGRLDFVLGRFAFVLGQLDFVIRRCNLCLNIFSRAARAHTPPPNAPITLCVALLVV